VLDGDAQSSTLGPPRSNTKVQSNIIKGPKSTGPIYSYFRLPDRHKKQISIALPSHRRK
jgi:hypothetical protein